MKKTVVLRLLRAARKLADRQHDVARARAQRAHSVRGAARTPLQLEDTPFTGGGLQRGFTDADCPALRPSLLPAAGG